MVLGGGGVFFVAWQVAYLNTLERHGLDLVDSEIIVGTSAGSVVASALAAGHLRAMGTKVEALSRVPALLGVMAPAGGLHPSQQRAFDLFAQADNARPETVSGIGHAALAAQSASARKMRTSVSVLLQERNWPAASLRVTATDAYSGERVVVAHDSRVRIQNAVAASCAVPGLFEPQPVGDRRCMDGGVSGTGTHSDLVAGVEKVLIISLSAHMDTAQAGMTMTADASAAELTALGATGTHHTLVGPEGVEMATLMDPASASKGMTDGAAAAARDAEALLAFWA